MMKYVVFGRVNCQCRDVLLILKMVGQGPTALAVGAGGGCLDIFIRPSKTGGIKSCPPFVRPSVC